MSSAITHSESVGAIGLAIARAQMSIKDAAKDAKNPMLSNNYATLEAALASARPALSAQEVAMIQGSSMDGDMVTLDTMLVHSSGEWIRTLYRGPLIPPGKRTTAVQMLGATTTYLRRYAVMAAVGIAPEDADGNGEQVVAERKAGKTPQQLFHDALTKARITPDHLRAYLDAKGATYPTTDDAYRAMADRLVKGGQKVREWSLEPVEKPVTEWRWTEQEQRAFFGKTSEAMSAGGFDYADLKRWCESHKKPKPSEMSPEAREKLTDWLNATGHDIVSKWLEANKAAA